MTINNEELASNVVFSPLPWNSSDGLLTVNEDNTFSFFLPCVNCDVFVTVAEGEHSDLATIHPQESFIKTNLKSKPGPSYPTNLSLNFNMEEPEEIDNMCFYIGDHMLVYETPIKKTKTSITMKMEDYAFKKLGSMKAKIKNGTVHFKINLKADSTLANILTFSEGTESVPFQLRLREQPLKAVLPYEKKFKEDKFLSAKLEKRMQL